MTEKNFHALFASMFAVLAMLNLYVGVAYSSPLNLVIAAYTIFRTYQLGKKYLSIVESESKSEVKDAE